MELLRNRNIQVFSADNVTFLCSGYDEAYRQALAQAVADSRLKADAPAQAAGRTLGEPVTITEGWQNSTARYGRNAEVPLAMQEAADAAGSSFQPGEKEITANETVTYRMNGRRFVCSRKPQTIERDLSLKLKSRLFSR